MHRAPGRPAGATGVRWSWSGIGWVLVGGVGLLAAVGPYLAPYPPDQPVGPPFSPPGPGHVLGTNDVGQDLWSEWLWATRGSLAIALPATGLAVGPALLTGLWAGSRGGAIRAWVLRVTEVLLALPGLIILILAAAYFGSRWHVQLAVLALLAWARPARVIVTEAGRAAGEAYVEAARALGAPPLRIAVRHLLPAVAPVAWAEAVNALAMVVRMETATSFLGLGEPVRRTWGSMLYYAYLRGAFLGEAWKWWALPPILSLAALLTGLALCQEGLHAPRPAAGRGRPPLREELPAGSRPAPRLARRTGGA